MSFAAARYMDGWLPLNFRCITNWSSKQIIWMQISDHRYIKEEQQHLWHIQFNDLLVQYLLCATHLRRVGWDHIDTLERWYARSGWHEITSWWLGESHNKYIREKSKQQQDDQRLFRRSMFVQTRYRTASAILSSQLSAAVTIVGVATAD